MMSQGNTKAALTSLVVLSILILVVTYLATSSLNPLGVYSSGSTAAKIIVSLLGLLLLTGLVQLFTLALVRWQICITAKKPVDDVICPGCGLPLWAYMSSHGRPIMCPNRHCLLWWHNGPACYSKGLQKVISIPTVPCPRCRSAASNVQDLSGDLDGIVR
jgi:uncharacterized membrane protein